MRKLHLVVIATALLAATILACSGAGQGPTTPTGVALPDSISQSTAGTLTVVPWACGANDSTRDAASMGGWVIQREPCPFAAAGPAPLVDTQPLFSPAPTNLRTTVTGSTVQLSWDQQPVANDWQIEVGSAPGLSNLAVFRVNRPFTNVFATMTLVVTNVPAGNYYVRVRSAPADFSDVSNPTNEILVSVGSGCTAPPNPPAGFTGLVNGSLVTLTWALGGGSAPTSFVIEAGSFAGGSNLTIFDTGNAATSLQVIAPPGTYFVRIRARNACGTGGPSNEIVVTVGSSTTTTTISTTTTTTGTTSTTTTSPTSSTTSTTTTIPGVTAMITAPATCAVQTNCAISGSSSTGPIFQWNWDFGDNTTGSGVNVNHIYATSFVPQQFSSRVATVTLTVIGQGGSKDTTTRQITITRTY